jgi:antitoxin ParD1/3/4
LEAFVQELIANGHHHHPSEVVHDALWHLKDQYELYKVKREELRKLIAVGLEQIDRGEVAPLDIEAIMAKAAARLQQEQGQGTSECRK